MKKILAMLLVLVMAFSFVACGDESAADQVKTPQELMDKVMDQSKESSNGEFKGNFEVEFSGVDELAMFGPMSLELEGKIADDKNMMMELEVNMGMSIGATIYITEERMLLDIPFLAQMMGTARYMALDMDELNEMAGSEVSAQDAEKVMAVLERFQDETDYSIYDFLVMDENMEEVEVTINDEAVDATKVSMTISLEDGIDLAMAFMEFIASDAEAKELFFAEMPQEDIDMMMEAMNDPEMMAELENALEMIDIKQFQIDYYVNSDFSPVKMEMVAEMAVTEGEETMEMKLTGNFEYFNIGGVESIELPEVNEDDVMNLMDMMGGMPIY